MQKIQFKTRTLFLLAPVTNAEVAKTKTKFLDIWCNGLNNSFFYCNYNTLLNQSYILLRSNNSDFNHCFFFIILNQLGCIDFGSQGGALLTSLISIFLSIMVCFSLSNLSKMLWVIKAGN